MTKLTANLPPPDLFTRVATILDTARERVVRKVNHETVTAYWLIGREIVEALQAGDEKAGYGNRVIADLALRLMERYGSGFSKRNLEYFRRFYLLYKVENLAIAHTVGAQSLMPQFHANLSWSHYKLLIQVENEHARSYYERECAASTWSKRDLERQISTQFYERLMSSKDKSKLLASSHQTRQVLRPIDVLKDPMILEFLNLPDSSALHESDLETAIVSYMRIGDLMHQDIGQMDGNVCIYGKRQRRKSKFLRESMHRTTKKLRLKI